MSQPIFVILAEGKLGLETSKTAASTIRYLPDRVAAVIDSGHAGLTSQDVLGVGGNIPVVGTLAAALASPLRTPRECTVRRQEPITNDGRNVGAPAAAEPGA